MRRRKAEPGVHWPRGATTRPRTFALAIVAACVLLPTAFARPPSLPPTSRISTPYVVIGYNDLGMHCMNADFSEIMVLPPFNTLHAQLIRRGTSPDIETSSGDFEVRYFLPSNTHGADKSNFWAYPQPLLGPPPPPNFGITGSGMSGTMAPTPQRDWMVTGIPLVPIDDSGQENAYPLATIEVHRRDTGALAARTQAVVPVSTEMSCNLCHNSPGVSTATDLLQAHDALHGTNLMSQRPVLCASCHSSNALGLPGQTGLPSLSSAMHTAHAPRVAGYPAETQCYLCHPGIRTNCQRDVHASNGINCTACHGDMLAVGNPTRQPWLDEPRCSNCHVRPGFSFEQPGVLYRNSVGHGNVHCAACHGSPHAMGPAVTEVDNAQANWLQGHSGKIDTCTVCHTPGPPGSFFHSQDD
ncbi:MAG: hypothetical protein U1D55_13460 [Phycisphaerae bacterium]